MVHIRKSYILTTECLIGKPQAELFSFFAEAGNLQLLTPSWLNFKILTPLPVIMKQGTIIDYRLRLTGIPFGWRTEITVWDPPLRFVDTQVRGPYAAWIHEHRFEQKNGNTLVTDRVEYQIPGLIAGDILHILLIKQQLRQIFTYRQQVIQRIFNPVNH
jgi:ligand-binding SRPBCC domain-containing protein